VIRPTHRLHDYLEHMLTAIGRIAAFTSGMAEAEFLHDTKTQDAVMRNLEIIGEAAHNVLRRHAEFASTHPQIPWRLDYELRNSVSHGYSDVDLEIVWATTRDDLPALEEQLTALLRAIPEEPA
jgi:uncharacterized protein with HEPN domain